MKYNQKSGFIKLIIVIVIALIVLGYFGFSISDILKSPSVSNNLNYAWGLAMTVWQKFLMVPFKYVWNNIVVGMFWNTFSSMIDKAQSAPPVGQPSLPTLN
ncbi:MAG: hypothetical protein EXS59_00320 [Candidatus Taylorbacteria bacterium]|nr:hypothetical protein [Candidatus Taylorbacteria bacterium]